MDDVALASVDAASKGHSELAPAKINLALHVGARRPDGYHALETLVVFADLADTLTARPADGATTLDMAGPFAPLLTETTRSSENLILQAAAALSPGSRRPMQFTLAKQIPVAAGLGGGSADAAATLRLLNRIWGLALAPEKLAAIGAKLGADVPMCLASRALVARGTGELITPAPGIPPLSLVLANPGFGVPTGAVFAALGKGERASLPPLPGRFASAGDLVAWLSQTRNDLTDPARAVAPDAVAAVDALGNDPECLLARMSGSGATAFGIFGEPAAADRAANRLKTAKPDWWVLPITTAGS
jgi:4-diphosphocytidyl-2-C-methyl-D-erythritol kinase